MLRSRKNQILLSFSFWPQLEPREGPNIYEMRSYTLKVGTNTDIVPVNYISPREAETRQYINITFHARVIVENVIPRNVIINRGAAEVDNHISRDDIFYYHPRRECNIYFITVKTLYIDILYNSKILYSVNCSCTNVPV